MENNPKIFEIKKGVQKISVAEFVDWSRRIEGRFGYLKVHFDKKIKESEEKFEKSISNLHVKMDKNFKGIQGTIEDLRSDVIKQKENNIVIKTKLEMVRYWFPLVIGFVGAVIAILISIKF